ncbi:hypothetical protein [Brachyspira alvinipulli]|uniref:hypothetical protein n=1 Tax=Brachyspira alvinipulli TaxID=84379 RepID=UPI00047F07C0|nr:hypothetical protein [Brachyspira alvinipulli]
MNKKILSIFVMVMALSLLGVSCNKKTTDPTNDGGSTTQKTKVTLKSVQDAVIALAVIDEDGGNDTSTKDNVDFTGKSITSGTIALTAEDPAGNSDTKNKLLTAVETKITAIKSVSSVTFKAVAPEPLPTDTNPADITITLTPASTHEFDSASFKTAGVTIDGKGVATMKVTITPLLLGLINLYSI